ncbi:DegT/DnrJ/EryC1/StrS family aminotransferase [Silanimonas sp.]|jgi:dTDP-4-amino-4,6-dideoxygalactose transaminase|uniref:DegT/DnrJ/EryC1/StrS family aminotransferase n=1 Tax=Silanimonas sp. TaxID=1929290 RepID=UPI0037C7892E
MEDLAIAGAPPAFVDPVHVGRPNIGDRAAFLSRVNDLLDRRWLTNNGPLVHELEQKLARYLGVRHVVAMCNGTIALEIAIRALGLKGEVILPSYTFIATAQALQWQEITPVFADIDPVTHNIDPAAVEKMITPRTTGIIGVHLWGRAAPVDELAEIARRRHLSLMFDSAHAFGATYRGRRVGAFGRAEVFSFHATKFFNCFEGGAVTTNEDDLATTMRYMRNFGFETYDKAVHVGTNGKMPEICAAMGLTNLESLEAVVDANRANHRLYAEAFAGIDGIHLLDYDPTESSNWQYVVIEVDRTFRASRDEIVAALHAEGILARKYFWPGCHNMQPFRELYPHAGLLLPNTMVVADRVIVLPTGTTLPNETVGVIADVLRVLSGA